MNQSPLYDIAVIGGGLAGLTAAIYAARGGGSVILLEKGAAAGGRATTHVKEGYYFNQGPHALYRGGEAAQILEELGVRYSGGQPVGTGSWALRNGRRFSLPRTPESIATSELLSEESRVEALALLARLMSDFDTAAISRITVSDWLDQNIRHADTRALFKALLRLSTYCDAQEIQSAGSALRQFIMGAKGVDYLDDGWQTLVDELHRAAIASGVLILTRSSVQAIGVGEKVAQVALADGTVHRARSAIATLSPGTLARLVNEGEVSSLNQWSDQAIPIHAACLDVALRRLPREEHQFALGLDRPLYFSVHTRAARLAPPGGAVIQVAKYLHSADENVTEAEPELEALLDDLQPGWRDELVTSRFLPRMLVANAIATAATGGTAGRPPSAVPEFSNLFVAGDWVGADGMLADASIASARVAAHLALQSLRQSDRSAGVGALAALC
jgi:phytoene dehydrogenase-like protein